MNRLLLSIWVAAVLTFAVLITPSAAVQGTLLGGWTEVIPSSGTFTSRTHVASAVANYRLWVIGGIDGTGNALSTVEAYYVVDNTWEKIADMPTARADAAAVTAGGKIYVIGGYDSSGNAVGKVEMYNPTTKTWISKTAMPTPRGGIVAVTYISSTGVEIHVYGSAEGAGYPQNCAHEIYDVTTDTWRSSAFAAPSAQINACGVIAKDMATGVDQLYLFGGYSGGAGPSPSAWRIAPADNKDWDRNVHSMPEGRFLAAAVTISAVDSNNNGAQYPMIIGGNTDRSGGLSKSVMVYVSGTSNGWVMGNDVAPDLPEARGDRPAVGIIGTKVYVAGGRAESGLNSSLLSAAINSGNYPPTPPIENPMILGWEDTGANILTPRTQAVFGAVAGKLYVIGGYDPVQGAILGANEVYDPAANKWTAMAPMPVPVTTAACGVVGDKIYVAGGTSAVKNYEDSLQIYNPTDNTWTLGPAMPTPRAYVSGFAADGKLHVVGGKAAVNGESGTSGANEVYDPVTNSWSNDPVGCPWGLGAASATVVHAQGYDWAYFGGGWWYNTQISLAARWNARPGGDGNDKWAQIASIPVGGNSGLTMATLRDDQGVEWPAIFGGDFGPVGKYDKVFIYHDPGDLLFPNRWVADTKLPMPISGRPAVVQIGNYVYLAAGESTGGLVQNTWRSSIGSGLPQDVASLGEALKQPTGKKINITVPLIVTRTHQSWSGQNYCWIEDDNRACGIKVGPLSAAVSSGNKIIVSGTMGRDSDTGEKMLLPSAMTVDAGTYDVPKPVASSLKGFLGASGMSNTGMLVRVCGTILTDTIGFIGYENRLYIYIDDGTGFVDGALVEGFQPIGLRVYGQIYYANVGDVVIATGILSSEKVDGKVIPILLSDAVLTGDPNGCYILAK